MKEKDIISFLKEAKQVPPAGAVEKCIASLPEVRNPNRLLPLIKLQIMSMPASMYVLALGTVVFQTFLFSGMRPMDALMAVGISSAVVALLFAWHLMLSGSGNMAEIEKCCKYSYGQILLARILCLCALTLTALLAAIVPGASANQLGIGFILAAVLPTLIGALAALLWANYVGNSDMALMTAYLVTALITGLMLEWIVEAGALLILAILLATLSALFFQTKTLTNRRIHHEAYHY